MRLILEHLCPVIHHGLLASGHMATAFILCHFLTGTTNTTRPTLSFFLSYVLRSSTYLSPFAFDIATVDSAAAVVVTF